jgi:hypothetical protein
METHEMKISLPLTLLVAPIAASIFTTTAQATIVLGNGQVINLATLMSMQDRRVEIGDKVFNFESYTSAFFPSANISLIGFISEATNQYGLRNVGFDLTGGFGDADPGDGQIHEANLQYTVAVQQSFYEQGIRLHDAQLLFNGDAEGLGSYARVDETIIDLDTNTLLGNMFVYANDTTKLVDHIEFTQGYRAFEVNKDLKFLAALPDGISSCSFVRQEFSQIPTPGAIALLGVSGLVGSRRRRA